MTKFIAFLLLFSVQLHAQTLLPNFTLVPPTTEPSILAGSVTSYSVSVKNDGTKKSSAFKVAVYLSQDNVLQATDVKLTTLSYTALLIGQVGTLSFNLPVPSNYDAGFTIFTVIDPTGVVAELNEGDNTGNVFCAGINNIVKPNLMVLTTFSVPDSVYINTTAPISFKVKNQSAVVAERCTAKVYLSSTSQVDASAVLVDSFLLNMMIPNEIASFDKTVNIPTLPAPTTKKWVIVCYPIEDAVAGNNKRFKNTAVVSGRDFTAELLTTKLADFSVPYSYYGGTTTLSYKLNMTVPLSEFTSITNRLVYSANATYQNSDPVLATWSLNNLSTNSVTTSKPFTLTPDQWNATPFYLILFTDRTNQYVELNESNNLSIIQYGPDFSAAAQNIDLPLLAGVPTVLPGGIMKIPFSVSNTGNLKTNALFNIYLSTDDMIDASDIVVRSNEFYIDYWQESSDLTTDYVLIPNTVANGTYRLIMSTDPNQTKGELNETNNIAVSAPFSVNNHFSDLFIAKAELPVEVVAGNSYTATYTIKNQGLAASQPTLVELATPGYGNPNPVLGTGAVGAINPGDSATVSFTYIMSTAITPGAMLPYISTALAPANEYVTTNNGTNNFYTNPRPDFEVSFVEANLVGTDSVQILVKVMNKGLGVSPSITLRSNLTSNIGLTGILQPGDSLLLLKTVKLPGFLLGPTFVINTFLYTSETYEGANIYPNIDTISVVISPIFPLFTFTCFGEGEVKQIRQLPDNSYQMIIQNATAVKIVQINAAGTVLLNLTAPVSGIRFGAGSSFFINDSTTLTQYDSLLNVEQTFAYAFGTQKVISLADGGFLVLGTKISSCTYAVITTSKWTKLSSSGTMVWQNEGPNCTYNSPISAVQLSNGDIVIATKNTPTLASGIWQNQEGLGLYKISNATGGQLAGNSSMFENSYISKTSTVNYLQGVSLIATDDNGVFVQYNVRTESSGIGGYYTNWVNYTWAVFGNSNLNTRYTPANPVDASLTDAVKDVVSMPNGEFLTIGDYTSYIPQSASMMWYKRQPGSTSVFQRNYAFGSFLTNDIDQVAPGIYVVAGQHNGDACITFMDANGQTVAAPAGLQNTEQALMTAPNTDLKLAISPNPVTDFLTIVHATQSDGSVTIELFDTQGRKINQWAPAESPLIISVTDYTPGLYFIRATDQLGQVRTERLLVY
jgi:CARDB/Secretion system C-terminal sorting domain